MDLARCLENLVRMLTPLPRLERTGSSVDCSPALQRPSPCGRRVGSSEKLSRPAQGSPSFRPAHSHLGCAKDFPGGFSGRSLASTAPVATGRIDNSPDGTSTRWPSRPRRSLRKLQLFSSRQTSFRAALPRDSSVSEDRWRNDAFFYSSLVETGGFRVAGGGISRYTPSVVVRLLEEEVHQNCTKLGYPAVVILGCLQTLARCWQSSPGLLTAA